MQIPFSQMCEHTHAAKLFTYVLCELQNKTNPMNLAALYYYEMINLYNKHGRYSKNAFALRKPKWQSTEYVPI